MTSQDITQDLRAQLIDIEGRQAQLFADRDEHSYAAVVEREPKAIKKLAAINLELDNLKHQTASLEAALREATKREVAAAEAERAEKCRIDAAKAADLLLHAEDTAALLTQALEDIRSKSMLLQSQFSQIRTLIGAGPTPESVMVNLGRSLTTAVMGTPMKIAHLAPHERCTVDGVVGTWANSIRNSINAAVGEKPAKAA